MKVIYILLLSFLGFTVSGQIYDNANVKSRIGGGLVKDQNPFTFYDIELYKHLGLGINASVSFGEGQSVTPVEEKMFIGGGDGVSGFENISGFRFYGIGVSKSLFVSKKTQVGLSITGQWLRKDQFYLDSISFTTEGNINLLQTESLFSGSSQLSYAVALDIQTEISNNLSVGLFAKYQGQIESVMMGVGVNFKFDLENKNSSGKDKESAPKNLLGIGFGLGIGDGGYDVNAYDLVYGRSFHNRFMLISKLSMANGGRRFKEADSRQELVEDVFLANNLNSEIGSNPMVRPRRILSIGIGGKIKVNASDNASLNLYGGGRLISQTSTELLRNTEEDIEDSDHFLLGSNNSSFTPEIGVSYTQYINQIFYVEGTIDALISPGTLFFGIQTGVHF